MLKDILIQIGEDLTMAATHRHELEMKTKCQKAAQKVTDPLELLRLKCLARGASGIKGIGR